MKVTAHEIDLITHYSPGYIMLFSMIEPNCPKALYYSPELASMSFYDENAYHHYAVTNLLELVSPLDHQKVLEAIHMTQKTKKI